MIYVYECAAGGSRLKLWSDFIRDILAMPPELIIRTPMLAHEIARTLVTPSRAGEFPPQET